ncbi:type 4a pilus biogenesis protein PilO [Ornithinibacillus scapharcae]|uniref:type 4a pilus biogenesis protein PilO n=1 Tax=Ornithinibacillus scapharcae TaxID=1147159 RepID=UPI000225C181|nr:type 4a pilus biogenesis protein PilO [Ornithinibacillus scapharcae]
MNKQKYAWILVGIIILSAGLYVLLYFSTIQPKIAENKQLEKEISMYSAAIEQLTNEKSNDQHTEEITKLMSSIPTEKEPNMVLQSINKLARKAKVTVTSLASTQLGEENLAGPLNEAIYTVEINGSNLKQINTFLGSIAESERLMTVDTLEINQHGTSVTAIMNITTYYYNH